MAKLASLLLLACALFMTDCSQKGGPGQFTREPAVQLDLQQIQTRGYLQAIVDNNSISYFIYRGQPMGYEYELLQSLTKHLKVKLKIKVISGIERSVDLLNRGEGDLLAFPLTITKDRTDYLAFTDSQFNTCQVLVQKKTRQLATDATYAGRALAYQKPRRPDR